MKTSFFMKLSIILMVSVMMIVVSCNPGGTNKTGIMNDSLSYARQEKLENISQLPNSQVCMVNNKFMNKEQTAVPVNGKTYYACCNACVGTLKNDSASRVAIDPLTGEHVDKATTYIFLKSGTKDEVQYFASVANATKYSARSNYK